MKKLLLILLPAALLASCTTVPATGGKAFTLVSRQQEYAVGEETVQAELKLSGLYKPESRVTKYVTSLCERVYGVTEAVNDPLKCVFINSEVFNAWATPGYINVYRGLLPYVSSEAELAAVIAHESGHISARHIGRSITRQMVAGTLLNIAVIAAAQATDGSAGGAQAVDLTNQFGGMAAGATVMAYGREDEREADALGQRYMERLGYDRREAVNMVRSMQVYDAFRTQLNTALNGGEPEQTSIWSKVMSSHPATEERVNNAIAQAGGEPDGSVRLPQGVAPATPAADPQGRKRFMEAINGMEYGPQRKYGIAGRGYVAIPAVRFVLRLPDGFVTDYAPSGKADEIGTWISAHPQSGTVVKAAVLKLKAGSSTGSLLTLLTPKVDNITRFAVGEETAYTGTRESGALSGAHYAYRLVAIPLPQKDAALLVEIRFPDEASRAREQDAVMASFQRSKYLSEAMAKVWQPLEVSTFTASAGDTVAQRAEKLPSGAMREEWFRALNGLTPIDTLKPGTPYKTITDPNLSLL